MLWPGAGATCTNYDTMLWPGAGLPVRAGGAALLPALPPFGPIRQDGGELHPPNPPAGDRCPHLQGCDQRLYCAAPTPSPATAPTHRPISGRSPDLQPITVFSLIFHWQA